MAIVVGLFMWSAFEGLCDDPDGCGSTEAVLVWIVPGVAAIALSLVPDRWTP